METNKAHLQHQFIDYLLRHGNEPASIYVFAADNGITEADFYQHFNSFKAIHQGVWESLFSTVYAKLEADETYQAYTVREKLLAFYYTLVQELLKHRSYVNWSMKQVKQPISLPAGLDKVKEHFVNYAKDLVNKGVETGEIAQRPIVTDRYADALWLQWVFVVQFWLKDETKDFERTDAAIEKAVNLSMDLMGRNTLDSAFDFAKFLINSK